jgi:hypothetical protein
MRPGFKVGRLHNNFLTGFGEHCKPRTIFFPALEVTMDIPQLPALHIVLLILQTFMFSITHRLSDNPLASTSNLPFQPDLYQLPFMWLKIN